MKRKIQHYENEEEGIWCYFIKGQMNPCNCGSNCYHHEYDNIKLYGVCNACKQDIYEYKNEYIKEELEKGIWK